MTEKNKLQEELSSMQSQLHASGKHKPKEKKKPPKDSPETDGPEEMNKIWDLEWSDLSTHFKSLVEEVNHELKDVKPVTLLGVFGAGVFLGRLFRK